MSDHRAEIFISYCRTNESVAKTIYSHLHEKVNLHLDTLDIGEWKSIKEYMQSIPQMDYTILLISDAYLKSANCMYEVLEVLRDRNYKDKIFPVVIDKQIYKPKARVEYVKYWQEQYTDFKKELQEVELQNAGNLGKDLKCQQDIAANIADFLDTVSDMNNPDIADVNAAIEHQLKQKGIISAPEIKPKISKKLVWLVLFCVGVCSIYGMILFLNAPKVSSMPEPDLPENPVILTEEARKVTESDIVALIEDAQASIVMYNEDGEYSLVDMKNLVRDRILTNPIYGDAIARGILRLDDMMAGSIVAHNTWLTTFVSATDSAMNSPESYTEGMRRWLVKTYGRISTRDSYNKYAELLCILLDSFSCDSIDEFHSTTCWRIEPDATGIYTRAVENSQNNIRLALTMKYRDMSGYIEYIFGIAVEDGSFCICDPQKWGTDSFVD